MATWQQWEGRVINGRFPLRQYLGSSEHSVVYLTEIDGSKAAIKLIPSDARRAQAQVSWWELARKLPHPHLIRILDAGRWHADDELEMLFVVMEYADENLAEVLPSRALTPAEVNEMLVPTLDALEYLHQNGMVAGNIRPANIMAVNDELKLSSDAIRPVSTSEESAGISTAYAAPESARGKISPSGDIWSLGATLVEVLTNRLPTWDPTNQNDPKLPENLPAPFDDIARHCLRRDPARRWSIAEIRKRLTQPPAVANVGVPKPSISAVAEVQDVPAPPAQESATPTPAKEALIEPPKAPRNRRGVLVATAVIIVLAVIAAGVALLHHPAQPQAPASTNSTQQSAAPPVQPTKNETARTAKTNAGAVSHGAVLHQVMPDVSSQARNTITGTVTVKVKVAVDTSGKVSQATLVSRGPSEYFANLALQAARKWTFSAPTLDGRPVPSEWSLRFELKRSGTQVSSQRTSPPS